MQIAVIPLLMVLSAAQAPATPSPCGQAVAVALNTAAGEICAADEATRLALASPAGTRQRSEGLEMAATHFRKAVDLSSGDAKVRALSLLIDAYDAKHLNAPERMEQALQELIQLMPDDLAPV